MARQGSAQYAFYPGTTSLGSPPAASKESDTANKPGQASESNATPALDVNLKIQNTTNMIRQIERLQNRYNPSNPGGAEVRGFK